MTANDSDRVNELFAASARDWTPAGARQAAHVLYAPATRDPEASRRCASVLSDAERQRADRFVTEDGKAHYIERRAFRRYCGALALNPPQPLQQIAFRETEKGRPYLSALPDVSFSFSACRFGYLGAWSSTHAVGVDLEEQTRAIEAAEMARRFFSQAEAHAVEALGGAACRRAFLQLWSLKEAALKSIGEGLPFGLDTFAFELAPELRIVRAPRSHGGSERFNAHLVQQGDMCAALILYERHTETQEQSNGGSRTNDGEEKRNEMDLCHTFLPGPGLA